MKSMVTKADMTLIRRLLPGFSPEALPVSFHYNGESFRGIPASFHPAVEIARPDANLILHTVRGRCGDLEIRVEIQEYTDFPVVEYLAFFTNTGDADSAILSDVKIFDGTLPCVNPVLVHGNGDTIRADGYEWVREPLDHPISKSPVDGTSCNGAFPYMRLDCGGHGLNIAVGWPAGWQADFAPADDGALLSIGQRRCRTVLHPGETMRTPRATLMAYEGDEARGVNLWRRWIFAHILPRTGGKPIEPALCLHVFNAGGMPEFTGADEVNQVSGIDDFIRNGLRPDLWWVDAGWYPCNGDWPTTGTWEPDAPRFPNGLAPIGRKCAEHDIHFLLWFEPERVRPGTRIAVEHPEWLLTRRKADGSIFHDALLNLGDPECCDAIIDLVDGIIKDSGVTVYRQDFNFNPGPALFWEQNEAEDRTGMLENQHVQGYLRFWDTLLNRNPGLWIDSCASGGRRNDLETMRRAVPLHYTDVGYGNHPIKQKQHFLMFQWIPYFRAHNMVWDDPVTGEYGTDNRAPDRFAYYAAMAPAMTDMIEHDASAEAFALAREMNAVWRRAARIMLDADYYPLTECRKSAEDFYTVQFHNPDRQEGFVEILANNRAAGEAFTAQLAALEDDSRYVLAHAETGEALIRTGRELKAGLTVHLAPRSAVIYFYKKSER